MTIDTLPIKNLHERHIGLTNAISDNYYEAATVCLSRHHKSPQEFFLTNGSAQKQVLVYWDEVPENVLRAWFNEDDATRDGAYACALAAAEISEEMVAVSRAETKTGADYYLAPIGEDFTDFENCTRLEVSGTNLDRKNVRIRLSQKVSQLRKGNGMLPAIAAVVGFKTKELLLKIVEEK